jgi:tol-pal system protein YbgF
MLRMPVVLLTLLAAGCASTPPGQDPVQLKLADLDARVGRMERAGANQVELSQRLDEVQASLRELRGRIDELEHSTDELRKQQRDLYADLDKRLGAAGGTGAAGPAGAAAAGSAGATNPGAAGGAPAGAPGSDNGGGAAPNTPSSTEQAVYSQAFDALKAGSYSVAITGFKDFLGSYPTSPLAENAQYWLGEAYYVNRDYEAAAGAFRTVMRKWPDSRKAPDALLKLGYTQFEQKQYTAARTTLQEVTKKFPGTDSARLAADRLKRIPGQPPAPAAQ